jgi:serine/threonine-protein kinase
MASTFNPNYELAGRYRIIDLIGVGHTAEVYLAEDLSLNRTVVVKVLLPSLAQHEEVRRAFRDNIVRSATLSHPHLARVYDGGQEHGAIFMITEYLGGGSLEDVLSSGRILSSDDTARLGRDVASALNYLHENGFVHSELSPSKLLFDEEGTVRVSDVALAGIGALYRERLSLDDVRYLSPEQVLGEDVTDKTDVYSLALIMYEAVTGEAPFDEMTPEAVLRQRIHSPLPVRPELGTLDMILAQAAIPDPRMRLEAGQFSNRLSGVTSDSLPLVVMQSSGPTPLLQQSLNNQAPRETIGFNAPSPDQLFANTQAVPTAFPLPQQPRPVSSTPQPVQNEFREARRRTPITFDSMPPSRTPRKGRSGFLLAAILIVVVALGGGVAYEMGLFTTKHTVPSLIGLTSTQAQSLLKSDGDPFTITETKSVPSATVPKGNIVTQSVPVGTAGKAGLVIQVEISTGPNMVTLPTNLVGEDCVAATQQLTKLNLIAQCPTSAQVDSSTIPAGRIVSYTYSKANNPTEVPENATVVLSVSTGIAPANGATTTTLAPSAGSVSVPNVVGLNPTQTLAAMHTALLFYATTGPGSDTGKWVSVVSQTPAAGTVVKTKTKVVLVVSLKTSSVTTTTVKSNVTTTTTKKPGTTTTVKSATPVTTTTAAGTGLRPVPNVVGMNYAQAVAAMHTALLYFTTTGHGAGTTTWKTVLSENPGAGTMVKAKSTVILTVK